MTSIRFTPWLGLATVLTVMPVIAHSFSEADAAAEARARTKGKVLQVKRAPENQYRVKVLMHNGQVRMLSIQSNKVKKKK